MKNSRENIETLVAKVDQLKDDLNRAQAALQLGEGTIARFEELLRKANEEDRLKTEIINKQRATIGKLRKRLSEE